MALFVIKHQHPANKCPAGHPQMGPMLLKHLSPQNAKTFGIKIHGEAVVDGKHTLYLILDAPNQQKVSQFMAPFAQAGEISILPSSPCERVVARGRC